jgi:hypothetical protein
MIFYFLTLPSLNPASGTDIKNHWKEVDSNPIFFALKIFDKGRHAKKK